MSSCKNIFKSINDVKICIFKFSAMLTKAPDITIKLWMYM